MGKQKLGRREEEKSLARENAELKRELRQARKEAQRADKRLLKLLESLDSKEESPTTLAGSAAGTGPKCPSCDNPNLTTIPLGVKKVVVCPVCKWRRVEVGP